MKMNKIPKILTKTKLPKQDRQPSQNPTKVNVVRGMGVRHMIDEAISMGSHAAHMFKGK